MMEGDVLPTPCGTLAATVISRYSGTTDILALRL